MATFVIVLPSACILFVVEDNSSRESTQPWNWGRVHNHNGSLANPFHVDLDWHFNVVLSILDSGSDFPNGIVTLEFLSTLDFVRFRLELVEVLAVNGKDTCQYCAS